MVNYLDLLHTEQRNAKAINGKGKTLIDKIFGSKQCNSVLCMTCKMVSRTIEPSFGLMLEISAKRKNPSLSDYFGQINEIHTRVGQTYKPSHVQQPFLGDVTDMNPEREKKVPLWK